MAYQMILSREVFDVQLNYVHVTIIKSWISITERDELNKTMVYIYIINLNENEIEMNSKTWQMLVSR